MSVNFGYGGMMNSMNMMNNSMSSSGTYQSIAAQNRCPMCYQHGPVPYNYQTYVNPLPRQAIEPSWISKIFGRFFR